MIEFRPKAITNCILYMKSSEFSNTVAVRATEPAQARKNVTKASCPVELAE